MNKINPDRIEQCCQDIYKVLEKHQPTSNETAAILGIVQNTHNLLHVKESFNLKDANE